MKDDDPPVLSPTGAVGRSAFVAGQVAGLAPLDFLVVALAEPPHDQVLVRRGENGALAVEVADRDPSRPFSPGQVAGLAALGFELDEGAWVTADLDAGPGSVADLVETTLGEVLGVDGAGPVDIRHGSDRDEYEARQKVEAMRRCIEPVLEELVGQPAPRDSDGDYLVDIGSTRVFVAPRARPDRPPIIRVFAITNAGLELTPELGLFLSRLNFNLMFGRFSIDMDHRAVWLDETLLGDHVTAGELRFTVEMVASTAGEWDKRIAAMFGGTVRVPPPAAEATPPSKPGQGGYL